VIGRRLFWKEAFLEGGVFLGKGQLLDVNDWTPPLGAHFICVRMALFSLFLF
jgi:hypothetical protein